MDVSKLFRLDGKVAVVTGASKGIGEAIASALAAQGAHVVVSSRKQAAVDAVAEAIKEAGGEAVGVAAHVGELEQVQALVDTTLQTYGGIDIVVNNAAANPVYGPVENTDAGAFNKIMDVNLKGPLELCKRALPSMKARGGGSVINISSIGGLKPEPGIGVYSASKAALISLTQGDGAGLGRYGDSGQRDLPRPHQDEIQRGDVGQRGADQRVCEPVAHQNDSASPKTSSGPAVFLASDASAYCTGGVYMVDGGYIVS